MTETLTGTVERFLFQNQENGYSVFVLHLSRNSSVIVKGYAPALQAGEQVELKGAWSLHPKFGKQFDAQSCTVQLPSSKLGLTRYLGSGLIKGIGPVYAKKLVDYFGETVLDVIDTSPERLNEIQGLGAKRIALITAAWKDQKDISRVMVFLQEKGVSSAYAAKIYKEYRHNAIALITENPYRLAQDIWGIGFKTADTIAQNLGFEKNSLKRIHAGIAFALNQATTFGHLYCTVPDLKKQTCLLLELLQEEIEPLLKQALYDLYNQEKIKLITHNNEHFVTLSQYYFTEKNVALKLQELLKNTSSKPINTHNVYQTLRTQITGEIELNEQQQTGIMTCLSHKVTIITGGPGTGKTTLIKKLLKILDAHQCLYKLAAPTGRAAKRITESTGKYAVTLHRLLEFNAQHMGFTHNEKNALKVDYLIIDEASMIDIFLAHALLKAIPLTAHVIFIGDVDQLPSVGAGNFLNDCIRSGTIPTCKLKFIFRQARNSLITFNAHRINEGEFPAHNAPETFKDFYFIKEDDPLTLPLHLKRIVSGMLPRTKLNPADMMVLSPMNRATAGTLHLNGVLQELRNPGSAKPHINRMFFTFKVDDPVIQLKNNYDKHVFNGDIGIISYFDFDEKKMGVEFPEKTVEYEFIELDELTLAYAISIHKSQGSEFDAVVIPLFMQHFTLLQRNLVYTALTRAKKLCIIIGQPKALAMAIKNTKGTERLTFLSHFLQGTLSCR